MARQPIEKLQGLGLTSSPSASPIDTYTGAPSVPQNSSASQLADALGTMSSAVAKAGERKKAEKQEQDEIKARGYAASFEAEEGEFLDSVKLGETYADLSTTVVANIVQDKYQNDFYYSTFEELNNLDDDVKGDVVALEKLFDEKIASVNEATTGMDFVNAGAVRGTRNAINELRKRFAEFRNEKTRALAKDLTEANVYQILGKYDLNTDDGMVSAVKLVNDLNQKLLKSSPFKKGEDKQQIVDALISYEKLNPQSKATSLIESIPFLKSELTDAKLAKAAPIIANEAFIEMELNSKKLQMELKQRKIGLEVEIENLFAEGKRQEVRKITTQLIPEDASDLDKLSATYAKEYARVVLAREAADPDASNIRANELREDIKTASSNGDWSIMGFTETPNNDQLRELISKDETLTQQDASLLRNNLSDLRKGFSTISEETLSRDVSTKFLLDLQYFNSDIPKTQLSAAGINPQRIMEDVYRNSMQEQFDDFYKNPKYETGVPEGDVLRDMKKTATAEVEAIVTKINTMLTTPGNIELLKGFKEQLTQRELPEVGEVLKMPDGTLMRYLGGDVADNSNFEVVEPGESEAPEVKDDPRYKVTRETELNSVSNPRGKASEKEKLEKAEASVADIFDKETATFNLDDETLATLNTLVEQRYNRKAPAKSGRKFNVPDEDDIMEIVLEQLGLADVSDFEYGGFFGDDADTAGEVAIKKIVDSLMEKYKGE